MWEIVLAPQPVDRAALMRTQPGATSANLDPDDSALRLARIQNTTRGGNPEADVTFQDITAAVDEPPRRYRIDAQTGALISDDLMVESVEILSKGTGFGHYNGRVTLDTIFDNGLNRYFLIDKSRPTDGIGNIVWDADNKETHDADKMFMFADANDSWGDGSIVNTENSAAVSTRRQTPAVDAAIAVQMIWDMYGNVLGRNGLDNKGTSIWAAVHYGDAYTDAHYNPASDFVVFGDGIDMNTAGSYGLDTVGHELGHWFWHSAGVKSEEGESAALNEGQGDVSGSLNSFYRNTSNGRYDQIRHFPAYANWRWRMRRPDMYAEPGAGGFPFPGQRYWSEDLKDFPEHSGGIPIGRAFIYLAEGAPADSAAHMYTTEFPDGMGGIGVTKAAHIWNLAVANYLAGAPTYSQARLAFMAAAKFLYGQGSMEHNAVQRAFAAIRVGPSVPDVQNPEILWAGVWGVNLTDMTAAAWAIVDDDTGFRQLRIEGTDASLKNQGYYNGDHFLGWMNISRAGLGQNGVKFEIEDGAGKTVTVNRAFLKTADRNLIQNGDFEDGMDFWDSAGGEDHDAIDEQRAFIGAGYLAMEGSDAVSQQVQIPVNANKATLVFRIQHRNKVADGDFYHAEVTNPSGGLRKSLASYDVYTPADDRNWLNKGYLRQEFDLTEFAGDTIRIQFRNQTQDNKFRFIVDQVVLTYEEEVFVDRPQVELSEWENTVSFHLPTVQGLMPSEISRVEYWIGGGNQGGGQIEAISQNEANGWYASTHLDDLGPGFHWVGALVKGLANQQLAVTDVVWFVPYAVKELIDDGGFENGPWDLTYTSVAPKVEVVENNVNVLVAYDGNNALRVGGQGEQHTSQAGQVVSVPPNIKSLDFSARIEIDAFALPDNDRLYLELWNANTFELISSHPLASAADQPVDPGDENMYIDYWRADVSLAQGKYSGKSILVLLKVQEFDDARPTNFWIENVSLRYTQFGIQNFNPPDPDNIGS